MTEEFWTGILGRWAGSVRTWFQPGTPTIEDRIEGVLTRMPGGNVVRHEYTTTVDRTPAQGLVLLGKDLETGKAGVAWYDSFHTAGDLMWLRDDGRAESGISARGKYAAGDQVWEWRTTYALEGDRLSIRHYNIIPGGEEMPAVEIDYRRAG